MSTGHVTADVIGEAAGARAAQDAIKAMQEDGVQPIRAWLSFAELAASDGWKSAACCAFIRELAKACSRPA